MSPEEEQMSLFESKDNSSLSLLPVFTIISQQFEPINVLATAYAMVLPRYDWPSSTHKLPLVPKIHLKVKDISVYSLGFMACKYLVLVQSKQQVDTAGLDWQFDAPLRPV